ncbi:MAG: peptidylprolyl isomerase [Gemmatimonas sp. SG8_38_2]|nr:MAG: peptidylprolyl isomerase [Gemmatimonas sp. SG8_38_2]
MAEVGGPPPVSGDTVTTESGLQYIVVASGDGAAPEQGQVVSVHYTGWFTDGRKFDSSVDRGEPIRFPLGTGRVIPGWDEGVALMKVGDKRRFIIPPALAYGERGHPAGIPPNSTLTFDVELVDVE